MLFPCRCFLNPKTGFIWAFIVPVVLIQLTNLVLLIMAATIMWQHTKKQKGKMDAKQVRHWLKALVSLVVVMGVTWIFGVVAVEVVLAYIYSFLVAFQGVWILLLFVVFDEKVRGEYVAVWKRVVWPERFFSKNTSPFKQTVSSICRPI